MRIKPTTISISEEKGSGHIRVLVAVTHRNGSSHTAHTIESYPIGRKVEAIVRDLKEILKDYENDGTLEG